MPVRNDDPTDTTPNEADMKAIEALASRLRQPQTARVTIGDVIALGRDVIDRLYGGDVQTFRTRGKSQPSFRDLARRPDLKVSPVSLYRAVAIYELDTRIGPLQQCWPDLGTAHYRAVLGLDEDQQVQLLTRAQTNEWSVRRIEGEVAKRRPAQRTGRRRAQAFAKGIRALERTASQCTLEVTGIENMERAEVQELYDTTLELQRSLARLEQQLRPHAPVVALQPSASRPRDSRKGSGEFVRTPHPSAGGKRRLA